ncbi:hypothetical protein Tco_0600958 [Tanacetum coccineum]
MTTTNIFEVNYEDAYDSDVDEGPNAAAAFMANLSSTSATNSQVNEVHSNDNQIFDNVDYQLSQEMHQEEHLDSDAETEIDGLFDSRISIDYLDEIGIPKAAITMNLQQGPPSEDVLVHQVVSMKKMSEKPGHVRPANGFYEKLNALKFVPQRGTNLAFAQIQHLEGVECSSTEGSYDPSSIRKLTGIPEPHRTSKIETTQKQQCNKTKDMFLWNLFYKNQTAMNLANYGQMCHTRNHRILPSTSVNARRAADHNRKLNVVDHNQFVIRSLKSESGDQLDIVVGSVKPQWKPTGRHFALYDNCPLTRIMEPIVEPLELTPSVSSSSKVTMISRFPDCKLSDRKAGSKGISGSGSRLDTAYPRVGYGVLGFLRVGTTHGYAVSSLMDTAYWSSE